MVTSLIRRPYTFMALIGFTLGSLTINAKDNIYIEPVHKKLNNSPTWMTDLGEAYLIGIQCSDVFYLSSRYLKMINHDNTELIEWLEGISDQFFESTIMYSSDNLIVTDEFIDFQFDQVRSLYKNDIRENFLRSKSEFKGLIKRDMNACEAILNQIQALPKITT